MNRHTTGRSGQLELPLNHYKLPDYVIDESIYDRKVLYQVAVSDFMLPLITDTRLFLKDFVPQEIYNLFDKTVSLLVDESTFPSQATIETLIDAFSENEITRYSFAPSMRAIKELKILDHLLCGTGNYAFLAHAAEKLLQLSPLYTSIKPEYLQKIYIESRSIRPLYLRIAQDESVFSSALNVKDSSWPAFFEKHFPEDMPPMNKGRQCFNNLALDDYTNLAFSKPSILTPKERRLNLLLSNLTEESMDVGDSIIVRLSSDAQAAFFTKMYSLYVGSGLISKIRYVEHWTSGQAQISMGDLTFCTMIPGNGCSTPNADIIIDYDADYGDPIAVF